MNKRHKHFTEVKSERLTLVRRSSTSPAIRKIRTKTKMKHFIPTRWAERSTVCPYVRWQKYGAAGILVHCWRTCEVMQPFWQPIIRHPVQWFSARGDFAPPQRTSGSIWRHFNFWSMFGDREVSLASQGRSQGGYQTAYNAQDGLHHKELFLPKCQQRWSRETLISSSWR